ncbi:DUF1513 domain-containing protein [Oceanibaculum sp.]|uniref:DUF1513 domain-containing protein n=1 Tax=Oceanibaculum sp. TaxID=1903597 RepID=UPI002582FB8B|nr:DUF1513 domain-containing protein [Oceanibaculum sp.]MCH2396054.1 DUF1513 domain-containing protein [Oceanibaculum sp.]
MPISRRFFLTGSALAGLAAAGALPGVEALARGRESLFLSARADRKGRFYASGFDATGARLFDLPMPARGHGSAVSPDGRYGVFFGRRPGRFALVVDAARGTAAHTIPAMEDRAFAGHGLFVKGGRLLLATEIDYEGKRGLIGLYDATDSYRRIGEWQTGGMDPHDLRLLPDGRTLIVANGGILTHPEVQRMKLNLDTMDSSVAFIDIRDGSLIEQRRLPGEFFQLSLRHMAVTVAGETVIAMQYEGPSSDLVPLVGLARPGREIELLEMPDAAWSRLRNYCGSAAVDAGGTILGVTSPRGGRALFWEAATRRPLQPLDLADGCGLAAAPVPGRFIVSNGLGALVEYDPIAGRTRALNSGFADARWDNHIFTG